MIKIPISFTDIIKHIILNDKLTKTYYCKMYSNTKYKLDDILNEIIYVLKTGLSWRNTRSNIKWESLYWHFIRLTKANIFKKLFLLLRNKYFKMHNINIQIIDSTFIMNKFGKNKIARNKFFKSKNCNKISMITDVNGIPLSVLINNGNVHDLSFINAHVKDLLILNRKYVPTKIHLLADKGYTSKLIRESLKQFNYDIIIPPKKNMKHSHQFKKKLYKNRINIEHSFQKLKLFRRIMNRYDSYITSFKSFLFLAISLLIHRYYLE